MLLVSLIIIIRLLLLAMLSKLYILIASLKVAFISIIINARS